MEAKPLILTIFFPVLSCFWLSICIGKKMEETPLLPIAGLRIPGSQMYIPFAPLTLQSTLLHVLYAPGSWLIRRHCQPRPAAFWLGLGQGWGWGQDVRPQPASASSTQAAHAYRPQLWSGCPGFGFVPSPGLWDLKGV